MSVADFKLTVRDPTGGLNEVLISAESEINAILEGQRRGFSIIAIVKDSSIKLPNFLSRVSPKYVQVFFERLGFYIENEVPLLEALKILEKQVKPAKLRAIVEKATIETRNGISLSKVFEKYPDVFSPITISILSAGETGGFFETALNSIAENLLKDIQFKEKIQKATRYPISMLFMAMGVIWFMMVFVVPKLSATVEQFGSKLPLPTRIVITASHLFVQFWYLIPIAILLPLGIYTYIKRNPVYRFKLDEILLKLPLIGNFIVLSNMARMCRTLAYLTATLPVVQSLGKLQGLFTNSVIAKGVEQAHKDVTVGGQISKSLSKFSMFPPELIYLYQMGEETGRFPEVNAKLAKGYENSLDKYTNTVIALLNPALMLIISSIVGLILLAMILPSFALMGDS
jgi:type IV pilus assembly protein PilC